MLDGELVCLGDDGRSLFHRLLFRRDWPCLFAFDLLEVDGEDLRDQPLSARKRGLRQILPRTDSRLLYVDHLERRGSALFRAACDRDLEGIVAKWRHGRYERDGVSTSWLKIKNPGYSQMASPPQPRAAHGHRPAPRFSASTRRNAQGRRPSWHVFQIDLDRDPDEDAPLYRRRRRSSRAMMALAVVSASASHSARSASAARFGPPLVNARRVAIGPVDGAPALRASSVRY